MAEQVQAVLDQMVAPLRDLMERGIFSEDEIRAIVARRRESEYLLRRRAARKADFLRYIEAELQLEQLRAIRTRQVLTRQRKQKEKQRLKRGDDEEEANNSTSLKSKTPIGDVHIVQHVHFLFVRALRKFRSDVSLHLQHAAFAKQAKSYNRLSRIYAEALQVHPRNVGLWIEAASLEFFGVADEETGTVFGGGAVHPARILLQRGLRINPTSQDLWLQYFALEFHQIQKLRGRREILQIGEGQVNLEPEGEAEEDAQGVGSQLDHDAENEVQSCDATFPRLVYNNAVKAIPDDVTFRLRFLDLCLGFPNTEQVEATIVKSIARDFQDKPEAWISRAAYIANRKNEEKGFAFTELVEVKSLEEQGEGPRKRQKVDHPVLSVLSDAVKTLPTSEMYLRSIQYLRSYTQMLLEQGDNKEECKLAMNMLETLLRESQESELSTPELVLEYSQYLSERGRISTAASVLQAYAETQDNVTFAVWSQWVRLSLLSKASPGPIQILRLALDRTFIQDKQYMLLLLELFGAILSDSNTVADEATLSKRNKEMSDLFQRILVLSSSTEYVQMEDTVFGVHSIAKACLLYRKQSEITNGLDAARKVYDSVLGCNFVASAERKSSTDLETMKLFFDECIRMEKSAVKEDKRAKAKQVKKRLSRLYDAAINFFRDAEPSIADSYETRRDNDVRYSVS